jgi:hypothetical protein
MLPFATTACVCALAIREFASVSAYKCGASVGTEPAHKCRGIGVGLVELVRISRLWRCKWS